MDEDAVDSLSAANLQEFFHSPAHHSVGNACQVCGERVHLQSTAVKDSPITTAWLKPEAFC